MKKVQIKNSPIFLNKYYKIPKAKYKGRRINFKMINCRKLFWKAKIKQL